MSEGDFEREFAEMMQGTGNYAAQPKTFKEVLAELDPADSRNSVAMYEWLVKNGRLHNVGVLSQAGLIFIYIEPPGTTSEGWTPGTATDAFVNEALEKVQKSGIQPKRKGICRFCMAVIEQGEDDVTPRLEHWKEGVDPHTCSASETTFHGFA